MDLGRLGVWCFTDGMNPAQLTDLAQQTERLGYGTLWYVEAFSYEAFSLGSFLLNHTQRLNVASGIANIYGRDATASKQGQHSLANFSGGRFLLGLGVSHTPLVVDARGHSYSKPLATMSAYLKAMEKASAMAPVVAEPAPTVLAALGPKMTKLAGDHTDGVLSYNVTPDHTRQSRTILGENKWLCVEQKVLLSSDPSRAREVARQTLAPYLALPNYRNNWLRLGFKETDLANGGTNRFLDSMVAWGDKSAIEERLQEHFDAGATHVCIQPLRSDGEALPDLDALAALAP